RRGSRAPRRPPAPPAPPPLTGRVSSPSGAAKADGLAPAALPPLPAPPRVPPPPPPRRSGAPPLASVTPLAVPRAAPRTKAKTKSNEKRAVKPKSLPPRPPRSEPSTPPTQGLTLRPSAPSIEESDSIHPEAYGKVAAAPALTNVGLTDREGVSRELIKDCEHELRQTADAGRKARLHYECARLYESAIGDLDAALEHYENARKIRALHGPTLAGLRRVHLLRGNWSLALKALSEEIELADSPEL